MYMKKRMILMLALMHLIFFATIGDAFSSSISSSNHEVVEKTQKTDIIKGNSASIFNSSNVLINSIVSYFSNILPSDTTTSNTTIRNTTIVDTAPTNATVEDTALTNATVEDTSLTNNTMNKIRYAALKMLPLTMLILTGDE